MVVQKQSLDPAIQKEAIQYAKSITGPFKNLNVVPKDGHMIKIPLSKQFLLQINGYKQQLMKYLFSSLLIKNLILCFTTMKIIHISIM